MEIYILISLLLFVIIYFAVSLAIKPLLNKQDDVNEGKENFEDDVNTDKEDLELIQLRDIGILINTELEEIIGLYQRMRDKKRENEQYKKCEILLEELKEIGCLTDEQYANKISLLKKHFNVD